MFVEAHTVGQDDWTTLPDKNGHTSDDIGGALRHRLGHDPPVPATTTRPTRRRRSDCTNTGTTGEWNAATGNSGGFQDWEIDLSAYKGKQVEVSITYAQDFAVPASACSSTRAGPRRRGHASQTASRPGSPCGPARSPPAPRTRRWVSRRRRLRRRPGHRDRGQRCCGASASRGSDRRRTGATLKDAMAALGATG